MMSLSGGLLSYACMALAKKTEKMPVLFVSIIGGVSHNIGQIIAAVFVVKSGYVLAYFPVLLFLGIISGTVIGVAGKGIIVRLEKVEM
jgi:heptaprenyl diphosphate synthase